MTSADRAEPASYSKFYGAPKPPPMVTLNNRRDEILLNKFRAKFTSLKSDLKRHNFINTTDDSCICNLGTENHYHFFFVCKIYEAARAKLFDSLKYILLKPFALLSVTNL